MKSDKLPPISQEYYDTNRQRFEAETTAFDLKKLKDKCSHFFVRHTPSDVTCMNCSSGWQDNGRFIIKDGKIKSVR